MSANLHVARASTITLVTTAETLLCSIGPFSINQGLALGGQGDFRLLQPASGPGAQGTLIDSTWSITIGTGGTTLTMRVRQNTIAGALVDSAVPFTVTAGTTNYLSAVWLDSVLAYTSGITYVVTGQVTGASANSTVNVITATAQDCNSFE